LLFVLVFLQALLLQLLFLRKEGFYFVDFIATASYFNAFYILVLLVILPTFIILPMKWFSVDLSDYLNEAVVSIVFVFGILIYLYFFIQRIFETSPLETIIKSLVLTVFSHTNIYYLPIYSLLGNILDGKLVEFYCCCN